MRRAVGIGSYYTRVVPVHNSTRPRRVRRDEPRFVCRELRMTVDVTSKQVKEQESIRKSIFAMDMVGFMAAGAALFAVLALLAHWVGTWAVVLLVVLAGLMVCWARRKKMC